MLRSLSLSLLVILATFSFTQTVEAKRYTVPNIANVHTEIGGHVESTLDPDSIKVFVWNMYKGDKADWKRDFKTITREHDILLLQEIYLDYEMGSTFHEDPDYYFRIATSFVDTKNRNSASGVAIASNTKMVKYFSQRSLYREPFIKTPKMVMLAEFPIEGSSKTLLTATIHAINFVSAKKLRHQLREVAKVVERHDGPVVWGGDFNTWSKKKMRYMRQVMASVGLSEVKFSDGKERMKTFGHYLDYVWTKGLNVVKSSVYGHIEGSDHKAMSVEFKLAD